MFLPIAILLLYASALVWIGFLVSVFMHFWFCSFHPHSTVCPLDAQHLTAALVGVEDLELNLKRCSFEAAEKILFIPTLRRLSLILVSDHVSPLYIVSPPPVAGVVHEDSLGCSQSCCLPSLHRSTSVIWEVTLVPSQCRVWAIWNWDSLLKGMPALPLGSLTALRLRS